MNIFVFGSSLTSTYWNGAATYYRGIYKYLHRLGNQVTFAEPDAYGRQEHRDIEEIEYADVVVYKSPGDLPSLLRRAVACEVVVKHSGIGVDDEYLEQHLLRCRSRKTKVLFWDVDAPATLSRIKGNPHDPFRMLVPEYDAIFTYGGGDAVVSAYGQLGARACIPIYNGFDPETHYPVAPDPHLTCDLAFVGHRLPDRESRVNEFFFRVAALNPERSFILAGEGWGNKKRPPNVRWIGHLGSDRHNELNSSARVILNVNRESMAKVGFSPPTRVFEAAGAAACVITDSWDGLEHFFEPEVEILCAASGIEVSEKLNQLASASATQLGHAMLARALRQHTYESRANEVQAALLGLVRGKQRDRFVPKSISEQSQPPLSA